MHRPTGFASIALFAVCLGIVGCQIPPPKKSTRFVEGVEPLRDDYRPEVLQTNMHEFTVVFAGVIERAADNIRDATDDPAIRRRALRWKIQAVPEGQLAGLRLEPTGALFDMWCLCIQMDDFFRFGAGHEFFGEQQDVARAASQRLRDDVTEIAREFIDPDLWANTEQEILVWCSENPVKTLTVARESYLVQFAEHSKRSEDIFGSLGSLEEIALAGEESASIIVSSLPKQMRWQADLVTHDLLHDPRATRVLEAADALSEIPALVDGVVTEARSLASTERELVLATVAEERALVLEDVERQRLETIEFLKAELDATRELVTAEREAALEEAEAIAARTLQSIDEPLLRLADHVLLRLFVAGGVVLVVVLGAWFVRGKRTS